MNPTVSISPLPVTCALAAGPMDNHKMLTVTSSSGGFPRIIAMILFLLSTSRIIMAVSPVFLHLLFWSIVSSPSSFNLSSRPVARTGCPTASRLRSRGNLQRILRFPWPMRWLPSSSSTACRARGATPNLLLCC